ncbi:ABC transporter substrate-binding protein [Anaerocolumna sp.]|uniref:ABC transporter substrate-binding protein n=1 Tax=Anaerocolumna sp. TaxID=2041569 RepID=UPI0028AC9514|nr:ABC transporter substrate-binding protein [Anaerocolumna sp.]
MKLKKVMSGILCLVMAITLLAGCGKKAPTNETGNQTEKTENKSEGDVDLSEHVTLVMYLYGSAGVANEDILAEINRKLTEDINTSIEVKYIDWGDIGTKYPLIWASNEAFDMAYASVNTAVPFYTLAKQGSLYDITDIVDKYTPTLKETVPESSWAATSSEGKIYGVPTLGSGYTSTGFVYNKENCKKWGISEVTDLESMIAYCDASVAHGIYPFNGNADIFRDFYKMLIETTGNWVPAPGISTEEMHLVTRDYNNYKDIVHPAFTDEFAQFVTMMDEWEAKGYWPKDILSSSTGDKEMYKNGQSSSYITHLGDWTGNFINIHGKLADQDIDAWYFAEDHNKIMKSSPAQDITVVNANSKYPERCVMAIEKFLTDQSYYNLWQSGIEGRQYEIVDGYLEKPANYDESVDAGGFSAWAFSNSEFKIPLRTEHPSRYVKMDEWSKTYLSDPYTGFSFDSSKVSTELSAISNVNSTLGIQLMLGKTDNVEAAIEEYRNQLKRAGIDTVIEEVNSQLESFTPAVK